MAVPLVSIVQAAAIAVQAMDAAQAMLEKARVAGSAVQTAQEEGRTHLTEAEWLAISKTADEPIQRLKDAIAAA